MSDRIVARVRATLDPGQSTSVDLAFFAPGHPMGKHLQPYKSSERSGARFLRWLVGVAALLSSIFGAPSCVTENVTTGKVVPRGDQKLPFEEVEENAKKLKLGMSPTQVVMLLGSPAEKGENDNVWIYLPERYAILIPARALRLEFKDRVLVDHGFRAIVLGARL